MSLSVLSIGEAAKVTGVSTYTLRYYEKIELLPPAMRSAAGKRLYDAVLLEQVKFIKRAQRMEFSLEEIKQLLLLDQQAKMPKPGVRSLVTDKLSLIDQKIKELTQLKYTLERLLSNCEESQPKTSCPILQALKEKP